MPLILGTNSIKDTGYDVANSCRFDAGSDASMHKTPGSGGNRRTWTFSAWLKRSSFTTNSHIFGADEDASNRVEIRLHNETENYFRIELLSSASNSELQTTQHFKDPSAWFHAVVAVDTTQGVAANRVKLYINGTQVTSFRTETYPDQNTDYSVNHTVQQMVGQSIRYDRPYDGYMAEVCLIDGSALAPTSFGEFDSDSPTIWKPKDVSGLTFGTNGFYLDFKDSSNLGNDANGGTDLTEVNLAATDQTTDTPTNNFATLNPVYHYIGGASLSEGNLKFTTSGNSSVGRGMSTIRPANGKWYVENKIIDVTRFSFGLMNGNETNSSQGGDDTNSVVFDYLGGFYMAGSFSGYTSAPSNNEIVQLALDLDNDLFWIGINDTWGNSATRGEIEAATATNSGSTDISSTVPINTGAIGIFIEDNSGTGNHVSEINFGNPTFSISSGNADANGYGNFEYAVPSGFYALCTKNLAEYG
jgi:hypothetical protein